MLHKVNLDRYHALERLENDFLALRDLDLEQELLARRL